MNHMIAYRTFFGQKSKAHPFCAPRCKQHASHRDSRPPQPHAFCSPAPSLPPLRQALSAALCDGYFLDSQVQRVFQVFPTVFEPLRREILFLSALMPLLLARSLDLARPLLLSRVAVDRIAPPPGLVYASPQAQQAPILFGVMTTLFQAEGFSSMGIFIPIDFREI